MKKQEVLRKLGKVITGVGAFALAGALFIVPAKADVISDGAADYAKGLAYLQQIKARTEAAAAAQDAAAAADIARGQAYLDQIYASTATAAAARDAQALDGLTKGAAYLQSINAATAKGAADRDAKIVKAAEREIAYLNAVNPSLVPPTAASLEKEFAWLNSINESTVKAWTARDAQAAAAGQAGLVYLNNINARQ